MKKFAVAVASAITILFSFTNESQAAGSPSDLVVTEARISGNQVIAVIKNRSDHPVDSFNAYFYIFTREGKYTETVDAPFAGTLRPGYSTTLKGSIYKSYYPGPGIVNFHEVKFFF